MGVCAKNEVKPNNAVRNTNTAAFEPQFEEHLPNDKSELLEQLHSVNIYKVINKTRVLYVKIPHNK